MRYVINAGLAVYLLSNPSAWAQREGALHIPSRANTSVSKGQQGRQLTEIHYDPATSTVQLKLLVQDPNGYFIPNRRRDNFAVYENDVRQKIESAEVDR